MAILQVTLPRSGGLLVWKTIQAVLRAAQVERKSVIRTHAVQSQRDKWLDLSLPLFEIDSLDFEADGRVLFTVDTLYAEPVVDVAAFVRACSHVWTDSRASESARAHLRLFTQIAYLVRDPRDALVSLSSYAFKPYMQRYAKTAAKTPREFIEIQLDEFIESWRDNVESYVDAQRSGLPIRFFRFEDLIADFDGVLRDLSTWLGYDLTVHQRAEIRDTVSFERMAAEYPEHVQFGTVGRHTSLLSEAHRGRIDELCSSTMSRMGYL